MTPNAHHSSPTQFTFSTPPRVLSAMRSNLQLSSSPPDHHDNPLELSSHALSALQAFYSEEDVRQKRFQELQLATEQAGAKEVVGDDGSDAKAPASFSMEAFAEDWNASQFWYSDETARRLALHLLDKAVSPDSMSPMERTTSEACVAVVSAPSVFIALKNILRSNAHRPPARLVLLEFDDRFGVFGSEFVKFDYRNPLKLPSRLRGGFDRIIVDPPFLSEDCQTRSAVAVRWLAREWTGDGGLKLVVCTGERMSEVVRKVYKKAGVRMTDFEVSHQRGLSNEFRCYANFDGDWKFY